MKRLVCILLATVMLLVGCGAEAVAPAEPEPTPILTPTPEPTPTFDMVEYKAKIMEFSDLISGNTTAMVIMANYEDKVVEIKKNLGGIHDYVTQDNIDNAFEILNTAIENNTYTKESIEADCKKIDKMYKDIFLTETDGSKEAVQLESDVEILHKEFIKLYPIVTTEGNKNIINSMATSVNAITEAVKDIKLFCGE